MKEIKFSGKVTYDEKQDLWELENKNQTLTANILTGIDELLDMKKLNILENGEEIEVIVRLKNR